MPTAHPPSAVPSTPAENRESHRLVVERAPDVIWTADLSLHFTSVSPAVTRQRGYTVEEALSRSFLDALTQESLAVAGPALEHALAAARAGALDPCWFETLELEMTRKDGSTLWVEANIALLSDAQGRAVGLVGVDRDITHRRQTERALRESERRFRLLAENVTDVIWTTDMSLRLTYISPSVTRLWGYSLDEGMRLSPAESLAAPSLDVARRALAGMLERHVTAREGDPASFRILELEFRRRDGSTVWTETSVRLLLDAEGSPVGILFVSRDITERRQVEQMKADFVTMTTHQLRTPLTGIKWLLELAADDVGMSPATQANLRDAEAAADRLIEIVNNLLDSGTLESGTLNVTVETTELGELTRSVLEEFAPAIQEKRCAVSVSGTETIGALMADPKLLRQAVLNLVSNAVKYTPPSGRIAIRMCREPKSVRWEIQDSGIGIPAAARVRLFQKFYRADNASAMAPEGTGLGLHLVRLIVERFGGQVWYESEEGKGSTFGLMLPLGE